MSKVAKARKAKTRRQKQSRILGTRIEVRNINGTDDKKTVGVWAYFPSNVGLVKSLGNIAKGPTPGPQFADFGNSGPFVKCSIVWKDASGIVRQVDFPADGQLHQTARIEWTFFARVEHLELTW